MFWRERGGYGTGAAPCRRRQRSWWPQAPRVSAHSDLAEVARFEAKSRVDVDAWGRAVFGARIHESDAFWIEKDTPAVAQPVPASSVFCGGLRPRATYRLTSTAWSASERRPDDACT